MQTTFSRDGIRLSYPSSWSREEAEAAPWTVMLHAAPTAFLLVSLRPEHERADAVVQSVLEALRAEYPQLEYETVVESLGGLPAIGHDIDFITMDTAVACWTRAIEPAAGTVLLIAQLADFNRDEHEDDLFAALHSLEVQEE